jgi:hypothetical protein
MSNIEKVSKYDYADVLIWLGIALLVIWVVAKIIGIN